MREIGNLHNRLDENHYFNGTFGNLKEGTPCTIYDYSDRHAYEVVKVESQDHIYIRQLKAIRTDNWGMSDAQNYRYESDESKRLEEIKLTNNGWRSVDRYDLNRWERCLATAREDTKTEEGAQRVARFWFCRGHLTDKQFEKVLAGKEIIKLGSKVNISFGVADEYYDYSF